MRQWFRVMYWYCSVPECEVHTYPLLISEGVGSQLTVSGLSTGRERGWVNSGSGSGSLLGHAAASWITCERQSERVREEACGGHT
jgi:hypothetical protein